MTIKKFVGRTIREALDSVKKELGPNAVILHTKSFRKKRWLFDKGVEYVEITASNDVRIADERHVLPIRRKPYSIEAKSQERPQNIPIDKIYFELKDLRSLAEKILQKSMNHSTVLYPEPLNDFYIKLKARGVKDELACQIIDAVAGKNLPMDFDIIRKAVIKEISTRIKIAGMEDVKDLKKGPHKVVFIGPTGVGKTTTVAKLAAKYSLFLNRSVGLMTIDTFRIAAVDQLRTYAQIMRLPLEVVSSPSDVERGLSALADREMIIIDTAGRSQRNELQMSELEAFLKAIKPDETYLVLSLSSGDANIMDVAARFSTFDVDKLICTKLDEASEPGLLLNVMQYIDKPIAFLTTGQSVPDDIVEATRDQIVRYILEDIEEYARPSGKFA